MRRYAFVALLCAGAAGPLASVAWAQPAAQVGDADKKAARDLYFQGVELQQQGKYADALDRLQRAQAVFSAPTHLLRIAECEAALGKLVEAAETYRALSRAQLPPNPPAAFAAAQTQGSAELPLIEPRIPSLKIEVTPAGVRDLAVTIDDQPMNSALVGAARPVNPGAHKVTVTAPGYSRAEQTVTLKERETRSMTLALERTAALPTPYVPPPAPVPETPAPSAVPPPPPLTEYDAAKTAASRSRSGFMIGARVGLLVPSGEVVSGVAAATRSGVGSAVALEASYRFARIVMLGIAVEGGTFLGPGDPGNIPITESHTYSSRSGMGAFMVSLVSNPDKFGVLAEVGAGYRVYNATRRVEGLRPTYELGETLHGPELLLGGGLYIRASEALRIVPKLQVGLGQYTTISQTCDSADSPVCNAIAGQLSSGSVANTALHTFIFAGIGFYFAHDAR